MVPFTCIFSLLNPTCSKNPGEILSIIIFSISSGTSNSSSRFPDIGPAPFVIGPNATMPNIMPNIPIPIPGIPIILKVAVVTPVAASALPIIPINEAIVFTPINAKNILKNLEILSGNIEVFFFFISHLLQLFNFLP